MITPLSIAAGASDPSAIFQTTGSQSFDGRGTGFLIIRFDGDGSNLSGFDLASDAAVTLFFASELTVNGEQIVLDTAVDVLDLGRALESDNLPFSIAALLANGQIVKVAPLEPEDQDSLDAVTNIYVQEVLKSVTNAVTSDLPGTSGYSPQAALSTDAGEDQD